MTVTSFTSDQVTMQREDTAAIFKVSGHYTGKRVGNAVSNGLATLGTGVKASWNASW
jgi:hypothetical protein